MTKKHLVVFGVIVLMLFAIVIIDSVMGGASRSEIDAGHLANSMKIEGQSDSLVDIMVNLPILRGIDSAIWMSEDGRTAVLLCKDECIPDTLFSMRLRRK